MTGASTGLNNAPASDKLSLISSSGLINSKTVPSEEKKCDQLELPFHGFSPNQIISLFQSEKDELFEKLANNNFSRNMLKQVNGFSKGNYTCGYYQENSIINLLKKHLPDCLKMFHQNIVSFNKNGLHFSFYLKYFSINFDIICLTEIGCTSMDIINKEFPDHYIFIDNTTT